VKRSTLQFMGELSPPGLDAHRSHNLFFGSGSQSARGLAQSETSRKPGSARSSLAFGVQQSSLDLMRICAENFSLRKTLALTPALSPRRGRAVVRLFRLCPSRLQSAPSCVLFLKQYDHPTRSYRQHAGERFTLSWGEKAGVRASVPLTFLSLLHSNTSRNPTGLTHFALTLK